MKIQQKVQRLEWRNMANSGSEKSRTIKLKIWIGREPNDIYRALTEPKQLAAWLVPSVESVPGKEKTHLFKWPHHSFEVEFLETDPGRAVTMSWFDKNGIGPKVRFEIEPVKNGSMVTVIHDGFDSDEKYLDNYFGHIEGWTMYLCNLKCSLDFGRDLRADQPPGTVAM
jgi:uncharacterized protein YndB with AHSA1/START domain